ncbi:MAG: zinc-binding dehydrogenase [Armatimonadetes bacterium]|nr:zinc-binding dehydrogenase [Armatimonadota bacterium]
MASVETVAATMRAAVFRGPGQALAVEEVSRPVPGPGEVLIRVAACGLCHTDLHYIDHGVPTFKAPPLILGHECSGTVETLGPGVTEFAAGDRVLLPAVLTCGHCSMCRLGRENVCSRMTMLGNHIDGGYAQWVKAPAKDLFALPEDVPLEEGAIIADALTTPYHAVVRRGQVRPGDRVVVIGCGGVGLGLVQFARAAGAMVAAVDIVSSKLELALSLGAVAAIDARAEKKLGKAVSRALGGGVDIAFEAIGNSATIGQAVDAVGVGGRVVVVGYCQEHTPLNVARIMFRELEVVGSLGCRPVDYPRVIEMVRRGQVQLGPMVSHRFPLDAIEEGLQMLRSGAMVRGIVLP